jgi:hypothetical protein
VSPVADRPPSQSLEEWGPEDWREDEAPPAAWPRPTIAYGIVLGLLAVAIATMFLLALEVLPGQLLRIGLLTVAVPILLAALLRLTLPERAAGMLATRSRGVDVAVLATLGVAAVTLALAVPAAA